jgi:hypothetical protein
MRLDLISGLKRTHSPIGLIAYPILGSAGATAPDWLRPSDPNGQPGITESK